MGARNGDLYIINNMQEDHGSPFFVQTFQVEIVQATVLLYGFRT